MNHHPSRSETRQRAVQIVAGLSQPEKIALLSGSSFWHTEGVPGAQVNRIMVSDGPHGLRKQAGDADHAGINESEPATCFPTAAALGSTWDPTLLEEIGQALGREARATGVSVILGPGLNIKRHPAAGRNFEYFSEDPLLSGKSAAALVKGIQSQGVGACLKHFAVNNQESNRMRVDTIVDERTLRELYLTGFEIAVTESAPWTVMSSYNLVNGEHTGESRRLLTEILREQWGFDGLVMSDWLAVADRPTGIAAGMDLEMPSSTGAWDARVAAALTSGELRETELDQAAVRLVELLLRVAENTERPEVDFDAHHALARRAAAAGSVLLTNDGILPLQASGRIALIGAFAEDPRYQGTGSSQVNPTRLDTALAAIRERLSDHAELLYATGYEPSDGTVTPDSLAQSRQVAGAADQVVLLLGLPHSYESEGFDRRDLRLPAGMETLVQVVLAANPRTVVVLLNGSPVELDWADRPAALLEAYLGGQAGGSALADVLFGDAEPGGRLAESFPVAMAELPAHRNFANHPTQVVYYEGLNVGYRFHDTWGVAPRFCFGHGLGYTSFEYSDLTVTGSGVDWQVGVRITNTGSRAGSEVVQLYVHPESGELARPEQELKAFAKVHLEPGQSQLVEMTLGQRSFAVWDTTAGDWLVPSGDYQIRVGASSRDLRVQQVIGMESGQTVTTPTAPVEAVATTAEFEVLLGRTLPEPRPLLPLNLDSTVNDLREIGIGRALLAIAEPFISRMVANTSSDEHSAAMMRAMITEMPLRGAVAGSGGKFTFVALERALQVLNFRLRR